MNEIPVDHSGATPGDQGLSRTVMALKQGIESGLHLGAQIYVSRAGRVLLDAAIGYSAPHIALRRTQLLRWMSSGKPLAAIAIAQLQEQKLLQFDDPIARYIPEFASHGKHQITVRHVLTHTAGFRPFTIDWGDLSWPHVIEQLCQLPPEPDWIPGERAGYHALSSWFLLGEIVRRLTGQEYSEYVRQQIFLPLGMTDCWVGMPPEIYHEYGERIGLTYDTQHGPPSPRDWTQFRYLTRCSPGSNAIGPAYQLGWFYEMLEQGGIRDGVRILQPETVRELTARHRRGMYDETFRNVVDWGLGFVLNTPLPGLQIMPYGYGPHATLETFGHSGVQSSTAFVDPAHNLVVSIITNGTPGEARSHRRFRRVDMAIYEDLGLTPAEN